MLGRREFTLTVKANFQVSADLDKLCATEDSSEFQSAFCPQYLEYSLFQGLQKEVNGVNFNTIATSSFHRFDIGQNPSVIKNGFLWALDTQEGEPAFARVRLDPLVFFPLKARLVQRRCHINHLRSVVGF